jgi:fibronectin type 3 domain-containing protein
VAVGVAGTSWIDNTIPNGAAYYYIVRAENDETCSTGPNNGGMVDANLVRVMGRDEVSQPNPGDVGATVRVDGVNDAHVRLSWTATPTAASYRVYRSQAPQGPFTRIATVATTFYEDRNEMGSSSTWHYVVRASDSCGNEGP